MTTTSAQNIRTLIICLALSVLAHFILAIPLDFFKSFKLTTPVMHTQSVIVDLQGPAVKESITTKSASKNADSPAPETDEPDSERQIVVAEKAGEEIVEELRANHLIANEIPTTPTVVATVEKSAGPIKEKSRATEPDTRRRVWSDDHAPPLRTANEFLTPKWEKLTYHISLYGIPVGRAELEAKLEKGEVRITLKIKSNAAISQWYPVDDFVETRHIGGNFIINRIRQQEGSFRGERGFTLFLRNKSVFWIDRLRNLSVNESIPNEKVVDILSGFYYLRNQPLQIGATEMLHIYDSNTYALLPVEVLRREQVRLPGFRKADTIVIKPLLKTDGVFKRTGDVMIWLTDDVNKVPVKVETEIPLGKVTAELVSAETEKHGEPQANDTASGINDQ